MTDILDELEAFETADYAAAQLLKKAYDVIVQLRSTPVSSGWRAGYRQGLKERGNEHER